MGDQNERRSHSGSENEDAMNKGIEGTAARTRPCSIEDIILKRSNKKPIKDSKEGGIKVKSELVKSDPEAMYKDTKHDADHKHGKDPVLESSQPKKKISLDKEPVSKDTSSRKEQKHSSRNDGSLKRVERHGHDARMSSKIKLQKDVENSRAITESFKTGSKDKKNEKRSHHRSRGDGDGRAGDYGTETLKEQTKVKKDRIKEKDIGHHKMEEREAQRKYEDGRDEKRKTEDDRVGKREGKRKREDERDEKRMKEDDRVGKRKHGAKSHISEKIERRQDDDYFERKDRWKESSHSSWQYEAKSKRSKRSLSPEHKKSKERGRSPSPSSKSSKRLSSSHKKDSDRDQSSRHLSVERSEKDSDEKDEKEKGGVSASQAGPYRRYGAGTSGLGGYSPRRRRSETAVKTPSPPTHLPERKPAWDLTPGGMDSNMVAAMVAAYQASTQQISSSSTAAALSTISLSTSNYQKSNVSVSSFVSPVFQQVNPFVDTVELTQSTRPSRRLLVANLPSSISDGELTEFLNSAMLSASANHLPGTKPCISCVVNVDKSHAVAEFLTPEDATAALLLDGRTLHGNALIIKRPKDFVEPANGGPEKSLPAADDLIPSIVIDSPHKIFIGGISHTLDSDKVREIVTAFGQLKAYRFEVDTDRKPPEAFSFLEYADPSCTLKACAGLNGMRLGGRVITVVQATPDASGEGGSVPFYGIPEHAKPLMQKPTQVLELKNVLTKEELLQLSEVEMEEISEDVRLECTRFGAVKSLNIVRWNRSGMDISVMPDACQNQEVHVTSIQGKGNGNPQKSFINVGDSENLSESLKDQQNKVVEDIRENGRERKDEVAVPNDIPVREDKECDENDVENKLDESGGASDGNALQTVDLASQDKEEHGNASLVDEVAFADKAPDQSVDALELGKHSLAGDLVQQEKELGQNACLDTVNHPVSVVATKQDGETSVDCEFLDVGSIFIEFSREEAACLAAHALHGRTYGTRKVITSYFPHSMYQKIFPRGNVR